ncbi:MAG: UDP-N-acetylmuramoyl-L-alanyl-D-glutamate--2,6-diaminopimelate ligase [Candidatus Omnitrophota bacterium]|jgi:UDP-N-acetylmuramoyl-L-alanyl-D-glutamate--2,6-diaminopimelate ligase|nr:MAG: UDP-N-acetylmuramoyl-L-alanyl-D-glutamate--2,6-diaminopimelate ligase [Candidatus Omnitrophota bacterium]
MKIKELLSGITDTGNIEDKYNFAVNGVSCDSRKIKNGYVFVAVSGCNNDGAKFINQAVNNGAKAVIKKSSSNKTVVKGGVLFTGVKDCRLAAALVSRKFYNYPSTHVKVIGITGTNGKTTISYLLERILMFSGFSPAVIGTVNYRFRGKVIPSVNTTPGPVEIQALLFEMMKKRVDYLVMEVSSHALDQKRTSGIDFHSAIFTNLTQDHLDYHKTMERYFKAKLKLFMQLPEGAYAVINIDDNYGKRLSKRVNRDVVTFGLEGADVSAKDINITSSGSKFMLRYGRKSGKFQTKLIGIYNVYNILAAAAWALKAGININQVRKAISSFTHVPGRLERVNNDKGFHIFIDYAHTPDALVNVISSLRQLAMSRIIVVFGCGGQRDKGKRPKMGRVVTELADYAIITNDNPRDEAPAKIINDIKSGIAKKNYTVIPDRLEAIKASLSMALKNDIVLIAGKGHEEYQIINGKAFHFSDKGAIQQCLLSMR